MRWCISGRLKWRSDAWPSEKTTSSASYSTRLEFPSTTCSNRLLTGFTTISLGVGTTRNVRLSGTCCNLTPCPFPTCSPWVPTPTNKCRASDEVPRSLSGCRVIVCHLVSVFSLNSELFREKSIHQCYIAYNMQVHWYERHVLFNVDVTERIVSLLLIASKNIQKVKRVPSV